ncbi:MAG: hypothetical protein GY696_26290, partial [Gammaproteobacteria bacterium]|nr:hypothetical protein [Gammaproteobacteria bacterium]
MAKMEEHQCFMGPTKPLAIDVKPSFVIFDLETQQCTERRQTNMGPVYFHEPNLCVAFKCCDDCIEAVFERKDFNSCDQCGKTVWKFEGPKTTEDFGRWLYEDNKGSKKKPTIAIAHNARGFDAQFLINYLAENGYKPKITPKGQEIMQMEANMVIMKDSLNFLPMSLAALPKAFGFEKDAMKGYFPHFFNTSTNEDYEGPLPDHQYYGTSNMKQAARNVFFKWYNQQRKTDYVFNLKKERLAYCENDVFICGKAIMAFRQLVLEKTNVDPLRQAMTIASTTSVVYRQNFLPNKTIGLIPPGGYRKNDIQSITAIIWLQWLTRISASKIRIQHARNGGEKVIQIGARKYKVDGYSEVDGVKTVYEFHGSPFHG